MCCTTNKCCCGCVSLKTGIIIAGIIDIIILLAALAAVGIIIGYYGGLLFVIYVAETNYIFVVIVLTGWFAILVTCDVLLICGVLGSNTGLIMAWIITGMINIVFMLVGWTSIFLFFVYSSCSKCWTLLLSVFAKGDVDGDSDATKEDGFYQLAIIMWLSYTLIIVIPIYYIYFWVTVRSYLEKLVRGQTTVVPVV